MITTTVTVWANPVIADGEAGLGAGSVATRDLGPAYDSNLGDYLGVSGGGSWGGALDEIRLGTDFGSVVPEPATMVLLGLGGVGVLLRRRRRA